jgi:hypothetical protein
MRIGLRLSEGTQLQLNEIVDAARDEDQPTTARKVVIACVNQLCAMYAKPFRVLQATGKYQVGMSPPTPDQPKPVPVVITPADVVREPLEAGDGTFAIFLGPGTVERLERGCAITAAANKVLGRAEQQVWHGPNEWVESFVTEQIATQRAALDMKEITVEQQAVDAEARLEQERARRTAKLKDEGEAPPA